MSIQKSRINGKCFVQFLPVLLCITTIKHIRIQECLIQCVEQRRLCCYIQHHKLHKSTTMYSSENICTTMYSSKCICSTMYRSRKFLYIDVLSFII